MPIITNKYHLEPLLEKALQDDYQYKDKQYSVTSILTDYKDILLKRRHFSELIRDVNDSCWLMFGTAFHEYLENLEDDFVEVSREVYDKFINVVKEAKTFEVDDEAKYFIKPRLKEEHIVYKCAKSPYKLSGKIDLYNVLTEEVKDYKTASVNKVLYNDWEDYIKQLKDYAVALNQNGFNCHNAEIIAFLKDWSMSEAKRNSSYPQSAFYTFKIHFSDEDLENEKEWIENYFLHIETLENISDNGIPICNSKTRTFNGKETYAVYKNENKRALRVCNSEQEAYDYLKFMHLDEDRKNTYSIRMRPLEDKRCKSYCDVCHFCNHYIKNYANYIVECKNVEYGFETLESAKEFIDLTHKENATIKLVERKEEIEE